MAHCRLTKRGEKDEKGDHTRIKDVLLFHTVRHFRINTGKGNRHGQVHIGLSRRDRKEGEDRRMSDTTRHHFCGVERASD